MEASGSGEHEDKRWSFLEEITEVLDRSINLSFPEEKEITWFGSKEGQPHDYECHNVFTIWTKLSKNPELKRQKYSHIEVPKDIGEVIMKNLLKFSGDMIQKPSIHGVGIVAFSLSRRWLAKSIHKMLKDGLDTWTPKLPVGRVMVNFPLLEEEINLGWLRQYAMANTLIRMLDYSKVEAVFSPSSYAGLMSLFTRPLQCEWGKSILIKERDRDAVIYVESKPPFILAKEDLNTSVRDDLKTLWLGIHDLKADWIVYLTPVRQQEYIEMCFTAAKLSGWIKYMKGKWNPRPVDEYPVLTYAGYRTYSTEDLPELLKQISIRCDWTALAEDAQLLRYNNQAVVACVFMYTCLKTHRLADCTFKSDEMVQEEGNTFVYLLHRRAEVHRITNNYRKDIDELKKASDLILDQYEGWEEGEERMLEFHLLTFIEVLEDSSLFVLPHLMCKYLYELSKKFKSYNDFMLRTGSVAKTSRLLLCEATAVVMEKCFHLLGISPEVTQATSLPLLAEAVERGFRLRSGSFANQPMDECAPMAVEVGVESQKMVEREQMDGTRLDPDFVDYFITPCFVSDAREPSRNSRFELISIRPIITTDAMFEDGFLFGLIAVSDVYGSVPDVGYPLYEPDFPYVSLFEHEWWDPVNIDRRHAGVVYPDNPSSHHKVPFSSHIELHVELYASTEKKNDCFQLCNKDVTIDLNNIWREKSDGRCGYLSLEGVKGRTMIHYILLKDAVDAAVELSFEMETDREVHGEIFAYYGDEFSYNCDFLAKNYYKALLYSSYPPTPGLIEIPVLQRSGPIPLKRSVLAVPRNGSLTIQAHFIDPETQDIILFAHCNFKTPTKEDRGEGFSRSVDGTDCCLTLKVVWK